MRIGRKLAGTFGATVVAIAMTATLASTAMADTGFGSIAVRNSGKCLDVRAQDNFFSPGARVQQWDCSGVPEQQWQYHPFGNIPMPGNPAVTVTVYQIRSERSGLCMEVDAGGVHALVRQDTCGTGTAGDEARQLFISSAVAQGYHTLNPLSNPSLCLDVQNGSNDNGNLLQQYSCTGGGNQQFFGPPVLTS
jgi:endo-1,4-beta-xylanase